MGLWSDLAAGMASGGANYLWKGVKNLASNDDNTDKAKAQANELLKQAGQLKTKSASETMREGREAAGQAASDKASQAKTQAKAASAMNSNNRMTNALAGAKAAGQAASEGYSDTANQVAATQSQIDAQNVANQQQLIKSQAENITNTAEKKADRKSQQRLGVMGAVGSVFSDGRVKDIKKHSYIEPSKRVKYREGK